MKIVSEPPRGSFRRLAAGLVAFAFAAVCFAAPAARADERPNFIVFVADDMGWSDCGAYGHPSTPTPNIDRLSGEGLRFDRAILTTSSCSPSRASILTGRYPHSTGAAELHQPLPVNQMMFSEPLRNAGYYTAAAGKWHLGGDAKAKFDAVIEGGGPSGCENWVKVLRDRPQDKPFFLWLAAVDPHRPYREGAIEQPHTQEDAVVPPFLPDEPTVRKDLAMYYDEISRLDSYVGEVLRELDSQGLAKNTCVLFITDNGRPFPRCKTTLYDDGIRTPLLVRFPSQVEAGTVSPSLVSSVDIAPTILALADVAVPESFQGESFAKLLSDPAAEGREFAFAEHNWHDYRAYERCVRSEDYTYIRNWLPQLSGSPPADAVASPTFQLMRRLHAAGKLTKAQQLCFETPRAAEELYDLRTDPYSLRNVATDPAYADVLSTMRQAMDDWRTETGDDADPATATADRFDRETGKRFP